MHLTIMLRLIKNDSPRRIDQVIDYFGERARRIRARRRAASSGSPARWTRLRLVPSSR
jgi:hypothetical protein